MPIAHHRATSPPAIAGQSILMATQIHQLHPTSHGLLALPPALLQLNNQLLARNRLWNGVGDRSLAAGGRLLWDLLERITLHFWAPSLINGPLPIGGTFLGGGRGVWYRLV